MPDYVMEVNVPAKVEDKIAQIEARNRRKLTKKEIAIAYEMFNSGLIFGIQWKGKEQDNEKNS